MSTRYRITRDRNGDAVLTIKVTGLSDMFRVAFNMFDDQCEFAEIGHKVMHYVARRLGRSRFAAFDKSMTNGRVVANGWHKRPRGGL